MSRLSPKATSVTDAGEEDGWQPEPCFDPQVAHRGETRILVSVPVEELPRVHAALIRVLREPVALLYRQKVDRREPKPQGWPGRDFLAADLTHDGLIEVLRAAAGLAYGDARCEIWVRGNLGAQLVLDQDGVLYAYPDDPAFREALVGLGLPEADHPTMLERDYVKHWFRAENDAVEDELIAGLGMTEVSAPR